MPPSAELVADKGYDSQALREWLIGRGTEPSSRRTRTARSNDYDRAIYKQRNVVERTLCRFKTGAALPPASIETSKAL